MLHILHNILRLGRVASCFGFFVVATAAAAVCLAIAKNEFILIQGVVQAQPSLPSPSLALALALEIVLQFQLISMLINNNNS